MKLLVLSKLIDLPEKHLFIALKKSGIDIQIIADPTSPYLEELDAYSIPVVKFHFSSRLSISSIIFLRKIFKRKFDFIYYTNNRALSNGLIASVGLKGKHIAYRGTTGHLNILDPSSWLTYLNPRLSAIVCVSKAVENYLQSLGIHKKKLITIYKGHEPEWYQAQAISRDQLGIPEDGIVVGCIANMRPVKGVDILISAFGEMPADLNIHLILVGEVRDSTITQIYKKLPLPDKIHFLGYRKDVSSILPMFDLFVMPSREREGLPKAVIEAMLCGVCPIVSDVGGMPELVEHLKSGFVVAPNDPNILKDAIVMLAKDGTLRHRLGTAARQRIIENFSSKSTVEKFLSLLNNI